MPTVGPAVLFKKIDDRGFVFAAKDASTVKGGRVLFQFKSDAQYKEYERRLSDEILPLFSQGEFDTLTRQMFGNAAFDKGRISLSRAQLEQLRDVDEVTRQGRLAGLDFSSVDPHQFALGIAKTAGYLLDTKDKRGAALFDLLDQHGGRGTRPMKDGRINQLDLRDTFLNDQLGPAQLERYKAGDSRPAIMFAAKGDALADQPGPVITRERRITPNALAKGDVLFGFRSEAAMDAFAKKLRRDIYPTFSSAPFGEIVRALCGPGSFQKVGLRNPVNLSRADLELMRDPDAMLKRLAQAKAAGKTVHLEAAKAMAPNISAIARYVLDTKDPKGRSLFDALAVNSPARHPKQRADQRINAIDVENLVLNNSFMQEG